MTEAELIDAFEVAWRNEGFLTREHEEARLEAGRARCAASARSSWSPARVIPAYVEREFAFCAERRPDQGPLGPGRHRAGRAAEAGAAGQPAAAPAADGATVAVMEPDVVAHDAAAPAARAGHDHRLQVERRPRPGRGPSAGARFAPADDLRDGLPGPDRPPARRRSAPLPRVRAGRPGGGRRTRASRRAQAQIAEAAAGIRARDFTARPDTLVVHVLSVP